MAISAILFYSTKLLRINNYNFKGLKIIDNVNPNRINRTPDKTVQLLTSGGFVEQGYTIKLIELRQFIEKTDLMHSKKEAEISHI